MTLVRLLDQSGGMKARVSRFLTNDNESELLVNVNDYTIGALTKRPGYTIAGSSLGSADIVGMTTYHQPTTNTDRILAVLNGSTLYYSTGSTFSPVSGGSLTGNVDYNFANYLDRCYAVGERNGTYSNPGYVLGTTWVGDNTVPQCKFIQTFLSRLYAINVKLNGLVYADRFYYTTVPNASGVFTWDTSATSQQFEVIPGETIKGTSTSNNQLLLFTDQNLYRWDTTQLVLVDNTGTVANNTIQNIGAYTFNVSRRGVQIYSGGVSKKISNPIQRVFDAVTQANLAGSTSSTDGIDNYNWFIGSLTYDGVTYTNVSLQYTLSTNSWFINSWADTFNTFTVFTDSSGIQRVYGGTKTTGTIMKFAQPVDNVFSDNGSPIGAKILSKKYDFGAPEDQKRINQVITFMTRAVGAKIRFRFWNPLGPETWQSEVEINKQIQKHTVSPNEGHFLQFEISESSTLPSFIFEGIVVDALQTTQTQ